MRTCVDPMGTSVTGMGCPQSALGAAHAGDAGGAAGALFAAPQLGTTRPMPVIETGTAVELKGTLEGAPRRLKERLASGLLASGTMRATFQGCVALMERSFALKGYALVTEMTWPTHTE